MVENGNLQLATQMFHNKVAFKKGPNVLLCSESPVCVKVLPSRRPTPEGYHTCSITTDNPDHTRPRNGPSPPL